MIKLFKIMAEYASKKVKNPLFNAAVTGGTFEEFSQNAMLLPAIEKPPPLPPPVNITQAQLFNEPHQETILNPIQSSFTNTEVQAQSFQHYPNVNATQSNFDQQATSGGGSNFGSVFSSFSNILKRGSNNNPQEEVTVPPPAGIDTLITHDHTNVQPVPLFQPSGTVEPPKPPTIQGPVNSFRRAGLKKPIYAQVPGLTTTTHQTHQPPTLAFPPQQPPLLQQPQQPSISDYFSPQPSISPASSAASVSSIQEQTYNLPNQFKPISPLPPNPSNITPQVPQPQISHYSLPLNNIGLQSVQQPQQVFTPSYSSATKNLTGPVMDAIPASEVLQNDAIPTGYSTSIGNGASSNATSNQIYRPVYHHWFYKREIEGKTIWQPFSLVDSLALEHAFTSNDLDPDGVVATDGGRYDVNILRRQRTAVYWEGTPSEVRRCSWFHKTNTDSRFVPYEENEATKLEEEYKNAFESNQWHRKVELANGETVVYHGPDVLVLFPPSQVPDTWENTTNQSRPRVVKRGMDEFDIDEGEPATVDHLLFMVHGIGRFCDLKFRTVEEVVDEFRSISLQLLQSHYRSSFDQGVIHRVEVLPVSWYDKLHSEETGIDNKLKSITLESIPWLRNFTNETLLDVLFYISPVYCQTIISTVGNELNRIYHLFKERNPSFDGGVSLGGHSLGSLILFDLLTHQHTETEKESTPVSDDDVIAPLENAKPAPSMRKISRQISYMMGTFGTGQPEIYYPQLHFPPKAFFALGSPIGMFVTVRGLEKLGDQFVLPTCPAFFNIFHPYDPVAYRIEALINPDLAKRKPVLIPHHKGRKRMHLELKETMARVGADLKQKVFDSMKSTWNSFYQLAMFHKQNEPVSAEDVKREIQNRLETPDGEEPQQEETDTSLGSLNKGRRIDYVLQEAPHEFFINEYIFAITSHVCYWESEDTVLLILKEIYNNMNVSPDNKIPQQTMTIERPPQTPSPKTVADEKTNCVDPTYPIRTNANLQPPPTSGFVRKS